MRELSLALCHGCWVCMDVTLHFDLPADPRYQVGHLRFVFTFRELAPGSWRVYIDRQVDYGGRASDAHSTHRLSDGGRVYVCWSERIPTLGDAKRIAATWAECTAHYIATGVFQDPGRPPHRTTTTAERLLGS